MDTEGSEPGTPGEVTRLLHRLEAGDEDALDRIFPLVYDELRRAAERQLRRERPGHTLQPTALVHEAFLKLSGQKLPDWKNRSHFFGVVARAMRQVLVDHARRRRAAKRGGGEEPAMITGDRIGFEVPLDELITLDEALDRLNEVSPRLRQVVEYRFFAGLSERETADVLGITPRTAQRDWVKARAWLYKELYRDE